MTTNTKSSMHIGCSCERCKAGKTASVRTDLERTARRHWKQELEHLLKTTDGEEIIIQPHKSGYTD